MNKAPHRPKGSIDASRKLIKLVVYLSASNDPREYRKILAVPFKGFKVTIDPRKAAILRILEEDLTPEDLKAFSYLYFQKGECYLRVSHAGTNQEGGHYFEPSAPFKPLR